MELGGGGREPLARRALSLPPGRLGAAAGGPALSPAAQRSHAGGRHAPDSAGRGRRRGGRRAAPRPYAPPLRFSGRAPARRRRRRRAAATARAGHMLGRPPLVRSFARSFVRSSAPSFPPSAVPVPECGRRRDTGGGPGGAGGGRERGVPQRRAGQRRGGTERSGPAPRSRLRAAAPGPRTPGGGGGPTCAPGAPHCCPEPPPPPHWREVPDGHAPRARLLAWRRRDAPRRGGEGREGGNGPSRLVTSGVPAASARHPGQRRTDTPLYYRPRLLAHLGHALFGRPSQAGSAPCPEETPTPRKPRPDPEAPPTPRGLRPRAARGSAWPCPLLAAPAPTRRPGPTHAGGATLQAPSAPWW